MIKSTENVRQWIQMLIFSIQWFNMKKMLRLEMDVDEHYMPYGPTQKTELTNFRWTIEYKNAFKAVVNCLIRQGPDIWKDTCVIFNLLFICAL